MEESQIPLPDHSVSLATVLTLCVLTCIITLMAVIFGPPIAAKIGVTRFAGNEVGSKVVSLDFERLLAAGLKRAMLNPAVGPEVEVQALKFNAEVAKIVDRYAASGVVVINHKALITPTPLADITDRTIKEMGLAP
jgi:hypothetical protein